jgi:formate--tetrahydrofolate ligase
VWGKGSEGGVELAEEVIRLSNSTSSVEFTYDLNLPIKEKIKAIATKIYGADSVEFSSKASKEIENFEKMGFSNLPICMAKNQYSLTDDPSVLGRPSGFKITIRDITISAGAGFLVALTGDIMKMPGLPKVPAAESIDVDVDGKIKGLF